MYLSRSVYTKNAEIKNILIVKKSRRFERFLGINKAVMTPLYGLEGDEKLRF